MIDILYYKNKNPHKKSNKNDPKIEMTNITNQNNKTDVSMHSQIPIL